MNAIIPSRRLSILAAVLIACSQTPMPALACTFRLFGSGPSLMDDYKQAQFVLVVRVVKNWTDDGKIFFTELAVDEVLKSHDSVTNRKTITVKQDIRVKSQIIVFGDALKDRFDLFRGVENSPDGTLKEYLLRAIKLKDNKIEDRLRYCFDHLENQSLQIASDAHLEFAHASAKEIRAMAKTLPADKIASWLADPKTPPRRFNLYGVLLGNCGTAEHAKVLRSLIDKQLKDLHQYAVGLLSGYAMLQPKEAWPYMRTILADNQQVFDVRFAVLRCAEFLRDERPDLIEAKELCAGIAVLLEEASMADLGIDFLCKAKCWDRTDQVLAVHNKNGDFDNRFVKRSILWFAMKSPNPRAAAFVSEQRKQNPESVRMLEEVLQLEAEIEAK
jgi:hypothetical protein